MNKGKRKSIDEITEKIQDKFKMKFEKKQFPLGEWGNVDRCHLVNSNKCIFLEIEKGQSHPDTNVSKVWPYLRENRRVQILLIQVFFAECLKKYKSRVLLSKWIGCELEKRFYRRFHYFRIMLSGREMHGIKKLREEVKEFCKDY